MTLRHSLKSVAWLCCALVTVASVAAAGAKRPADMPVRSYFADADAQATPFTLQSDALGAYVNGVSGVVSVLMANVYNNLYNGDWEMDGLGATGRTVAITLEPANAVAFGEPGYTVAPRPPFWGTGLVAARVIDKCTAFGKSVLAMAPGTAMTCPLIVRWDTGGSFRLEIGSPNTAPETSPAQITCNSADATGCTDWFLDPSPTVASDGTVSSRAIARLVSVAKNGTETNLGDFYMTFHFHVTRP